MIAGIVLGLAALFLIAERSFLLGNTFDVVATYNRVSGLQPGASVFYNGIGVGRVEEVRLPNAPGNPIEVRMAIREDAHHLIREDSRALIQTEGLVGNMMVAITAGSPSRPAVGNGGRIRGIEPLQLSEFSDKALESVQRLDSLTTAIASVIGDVRSGEGSLSKFLYDDALYNETVLTTQEFRSAMQGFTGRADALLGIAERGSAGVEEVLGKINEGEGSLGLLLNDDEAYNALLQASAQFATISDDLKGVTERFENAAGWASLGAFRFSENMEALKHNFLFKGYFEDRGYLEMAPFEVREQAISETLADLQDWERRLYRREQELDSLQAVVSSNLEQPYEDVENADDESPPAADSSVE